MAKFVISGHTATLVSSIKLADVKKVMSFDPEVLCLKDEDGNPVFAVAIGTGEGSVGNYGVEFSPKPDLNGNAIATMKMGFANASVEEVKKELAEAFAAPLAKLAKIEDAVPASLTAIDLKIEKAMEKIEVL